MVGLPYSSSSSSRRSRRRSAGPLECCRWSILRCNRDDCDGTMTQRVYTCTLVTCRVEYGNHQVYAGLNRSPSAGLVRNLYTVIYVSWWTCWRLWSPKEPLDIYDTVRASSSGGFFEMMCRSERHGGELAPWRRVVGAKLVRVPSHLSDDKTNTVIWNTPDIVATQQFYTQHYYQCAIFDNDIRYYSQLLH